MYRLIQYHSSNAIRFIRYFQLGKIINRFWLFINTEGVDIIFFSTEIWTTVYILENHLSYRGIWNENRSIAGEKQAIYVFTNIEKLLNFSTNELIFFFFNRVQKIYF